MRTWIAIHLPLLPLEALLPSRDESAVHVVADHRRVLVASRGALAAGIRPGMPRSMVSGLCPGATLLVPDRQAEQDALGGLALALLQYTAEIAHAEENSLLLDVSASLRFFGGRRALYRLVRTTVSAFGHACRIGMAPTAQGAWLLARNPPLGRRALKQRRAVRMPTLARLLDRLPPSLLPAARPYDEWLNGIGCRSLEDLRRLPRAGLKRRCDGALLDALDRAYGEAPELFEWIKPPKEFNVRLELPERVELAEALLFVARRLLLQMSGWLVAQQLAVSRFVLRMEHERGRQAPPPTSLEISLAEAVWQEPHLTHLLKERLGRLQLDAPVIALRLTADKLEDMRPVNASLFPDPGGSPADYKRLLDLLIARLGEECVLAPAPQDDHRPAQCNDWGPAGMEKAEEARFPPQERPFWLLEKPIALPVHGNQPFYRSLLHLVSKPERIEYGWWDGQLLVRDYFKAQAEDGICYWIYRERHGDRLSWGLHGLFG